MVDSTKDSGRRQFLGGALSFLTGLGLLSTATATTIFRFVFGPRDNAQTKELESERQVLLAQTTEEGKLELVRQTDDQIFVSRLSDLDAAKGVYFTDYEMQQALAFVDSHNLPILLSAKCTHLGCTVGSQVDDNGRVLCPCHISYFDIYTGNPSPGSPAKKPLPRLNWIVKDEAGEVVASKINGAVAGATELKDLDKLSVFLVKEDRKWI